MTGLRWWARQAAGGYPTRLWVTVLALWAIVVGVAVAPGSRPASALVYAVTAIGTICLPFRWVRGIFLLATATAVLRQSGFGVGQVLLAALAVAATVLVLALLDGWDTDGPLAAHARVVRHDDDRAWILARTGALATLLDVAALMVLVWAVLSTAGVPVPGWWVATVPVAVVAGIAVATSSVWWHGHRDDFTGLPRSSGG
ncbi:MAG: hypothetical protein ACRDP1_17355 [Nocardioidaceae bacterium]